MHRRRARVSTLVGVAFGARGRVMGTNRIAALKPALPRLHALLVQPLTWDALAAHCRRNRWARVRDATLLDEEFEARLSRGLVLRGEIDPGEGGWHAALVALWDRRWDTSRGAGKRLVCEYEMTHRAFDEAFDRAREVAVGTLGAPTGAGSRRPRYNYSWPTRRHVFWEEGGRVLLLCQSEDPAAGGRSVLVWLGSRSHLRRDPYLPHRLTAGQAEPGTTPERPRD
jgi:hypothetical protein